MVEFLVQLAIIMVACGFAYWAWLQVSPRIGFIAEPFKGWLDLLILILIGAIIIFWVVIPFIRIIPRLLH